MLSFVPGSLVAQFADSGDNIYMLFAAWKVRIWKTVTEVLKMLPKAAGRGQHFQARGHSFSLNGPTLSRQITYLLGYKCRVCLRNFIIESAYAPFTNHSKRSKERTSE